MESVRFVWGYLKKYRYRYFLGLFLVFCAAGLALVPSVYTGKIMREVIQGGQKQMLFPYLFTWSASVLVMVFIRYGR